MHSNASNVLFLIPIKYQRYQMIPKNMIPNRINAVFYLLNQYMHYLTVYIKNRDSVRLQPVIHIKKQKV